MVVKMDIPGKPTLFWHFNIFRVPWSGMILYNGQRRTTGADFVSLGLVGGRLEFRSVALNWIEFILSFNSSFLWSYASTKHSNELDLHRRRFDVGSGMATIRDPNPIKLGEFHTVELYRNHTVGYIILDGGEPINGSSQVLHSFKANLVTCLISSTDKFLFSPCLHSGQVPRLGPQWGALCGWLPQLHTSCQNCWH